MFISHRLEHLTQAQRTFQLVLGDQRRYGTAYQGAVNADADVVFATVASATSSDALMSRRFDYVVVDEFHHAAAPTYERLLAALQPKFLLGLTATPERQDGHDVLRLCDFNVAYEVRLVEAINRGWLLPFHYFGLSDETVDYSKIPWRSGQFDPSALENALMIEGRVDAMLRHCRARGFDGQRRATVGFCAGVRHASFMARALTARGLQAESVSGAMKVEDRERIYRRLADVDDPLEWLFVADVLNEGVDIPEINSIVFLRPTESATVFIQQLGRGLRLTPRCEVLTVLDFVGHHRNAWLAVETLADRDAPVGPSTVTELGITPPAGCEIVLDIRTREILEKVRRVGVSRRNRLLECYRRLKEESGVERPYPVDLLGSEHAPALSEVRATFGTWVDLRLAAGDAQEWEAALTPAHPSYQLLLAAERDWQAQRVYGYAALWGMCASPETPETGYEQFFERFPRWRVEYKQLGDSNVLETLAKKLGSLVQNGRLTRISLSGIPMQLLLSEIEGRIQYLLEKDFRVRHGGVLRDPAELVLHRRYSRPEVVNYFGQQYDPARHNLGVLRFTAPRDHVAILTKLDTSGAIARHQYANRFVDPQTFLWTSQNKQSRSNAAGQLILDHRRYDRSIHLFVQAASHEKLAYCGLVDVLDAEGDAPMVVRFSLREPLGDSVRRELGIDFV